MRYVTNTLFMIIAGCGLAALSACSTRLSEKFDADSIGAPPPAAPSPNPPADQFLWSTIEMTTSVAARPGGGRWAVIQATPRYFELRHIGANEAAGAMLAATEPFSGNKRTVHGTVSLAVKGAGRAVLILKIRQSTGPGFTGPGGYIGAIKMECMGVDNKEYLSWVNSSQVPSENASPYFPFGTGFGSPHTCGEPVKVNWSIDQKEQNGNVNEADSRDRSLDISYSPADGGVANFPIQGIVASLLVAPGWNGNPPNMDFRVFVDDLMIEQEK